MGIPTFQDGMFPKCTHLLLCRAQILPIRDQFGVDLQMGVWYDECVGADFSGPLFCPRPRASAELKWPPTSSRGSFQFLGFDHWVTSLSAESTGLFWFGWNPFRKHSCSSAYRCDWHLCKTEEVESPAGRCHYHIWYHLFSYHQSTMFQACLQDGISHK